VLAGSFNKRWLADVIVDGNRVIADAPIVNPQFTEDATSLVQGSGSCTIVWQDDFGASVAPDQIGDWFAPFGTVIAISVVVTVGDGFVERIPFGQFLIAETPSTITTTFAYKGATLSKGDRIDLNLKDLFYGVQRDRFDTPGAAPDLSSVWAEYQRLLGFPVTVPASVPDAAIPTSVAYQEDKLQACYDLAAVLDATCYMTADGTGSMRPNVWPAPVDTLKWGDGGTLLSFDRALANDNVYNKVVIRSTAGDGSAILGMAEISDGPLRTHNADGSLSPYRRVPYFYSSDYITTTGAASKYAQTLLPRVSKLRSVIVTLTEAFNPLREVGDVLTIIRQSETLLGRVTQINRDSSGSQQTVVVVNQ